MKIGSTLIEDKEGRDHMSNMSTLTVLLGFISNATHCNMESGSHISEWISNSPEMSPVKHLKRRHMKDELQGELRQIKPSTFDGENKGKDAEAWLLGMRKYF